MRSISLAFGASVALSLSAAPLLAQDTTGVPHCVTAKARVEILWCQGSLAYSREEYARAIPPYHDALLLEQAHRQLERNGWLVLVDNLTIAYGITGDLPHAKATLEYGISVDPGYPLFYYNLACVYAGLGDKPRTLAALNQAFDRRANVISGETIPDPRRDDSFTSFMTDTAFARAVERLPGIQRR